MLPEFLPYGDLPEGVHRATLEEVLRRFGTTTPQRRIVAERLARVYRIAVATKGLSRFVIFGSFVIKDRRKSENVRTFCSLVIAVIGIWNLFSGH